MWKTTWINWASTAKIYSTSTILSHVNMQAITSYTSMNTIHTRISVYTKVYKKMDKRIYNLWCESALMALTLLWDCRSYNNIWTFVSEWLGSSQSFEDRNDRIKDADLFDRSLDLTFYLKDYSCCYVVLTCVSVTKSLSCYWKHLDLWKNKSKIMNLCYGDCRDSCFSLECSIIQV